MTAVKRTIIILSLCAIWFGGMLIGFSVGTAMADEKYTDLSGTGVQQLVRTYFENMEKIVLMKSMKELTLQHGCRCRSRTGR